MNFLFLKQIEGTFTFAIGIETHLFWLVGTEKWHPLPTDLNRLILTSQVLVVSAYVMLFLLRGLLFIILYSPSQWKFPKLCLPSTFHQLWRAAAHRWGDAGKTLGFLFLSQNLFSSSNLPAASTLALLHFAR